MSNETYVNAGSSPKPPFSVFGAMKATDEVLEQAVLRTSNILERLRGAQPEVPGTTKAGSSNVEGVASDVADKLRALSNNIAAIDAII